MHRTHDRSIRPPVRASKNSDLVLYGGRALRTKRISTETGNLRVGWNWHSACSFGSCMYTSIGIVLRYADITLRAAVFVLPSHESRDSLSRVVMMISF